MILIKLKSVAIRLLISKNPPSNYGGFSICKKRAK
jgi:hypothetical protein